MLVPALPEVVARRRPLKRAADSTARPARVSVPGRARRRVALIARLARVFVLALALRRVLLVPLKAALVRAELVPLVAREVEAEVAEAARRWYS